MTRDKNVIKPGKGTRQCNCKNKMVTRQVGPGMFQQYTTQECEECQALQYVREAETLSVTVEAGTPDSHVSHLPAACPPHDRCQQRWLIIEHRRCHVSTGKKVVHSLGNNKVWVEG